MISLIISCNLREGRDPQDVEHISLLTLCFPVYLVTPKCTFTPLSCSFELDTKLSMSGLKTNASPLSLKA